MKSFFLFLFLMFGSALALLALLGALAWSQIPSDREIRGCLVTKLFEVNLCPGSKNYTPLSMIAKSLQQTVVLSEDASFWQHNGFDLDELQKSAETNLKKGRFAGEGPQSPSNWPKICF